MEKKSKLFTIDADVSEQLKGVSNMSALVNSLLREHFGQDLEYLERAKTKVELELIDVERRIDNKKKLLSVKKEKEVHEKRILDLQEQKVKHDFEKKANDIIQNNKLNPLFQKVLVRCLKDGEYKYNRIEYPINELIKKIKELYGTVEEQTENYNKLDDKQKKYIEGGFSL